MNTLRPQLRTIREWLDNAALELRNANVASAQLDAEIILAHTIRRPRTWLRAHDDEWLEPRQREIADARLALRLDRTPIAYIIGHKEFYGRRFTVSPAVLIPRPESEAIIDSVKQHLPRDATTLVDVGTGSGCLAITLKLELPSLTITAIDSENHALAVASRNARQLGADIECHKGNLLRSLIRPVDIIVANLPYVDPTWDVSPELQHEPPSALYAERGGLALIEQLVPQASANLQIGGLLVLEADTSQHQAIRELCEHHGFSQLETNGLVLSFRRA